MLYSVFLRSGVDALQAIETEIRREKGQALVGPASGWKMP
jgi:hypothetical protein